MNLPGVQVVLRVRSLAEVLDLAFLFCLRHLRTLLRLGTVALLPVLVAAVTARHAGGASWPLVWTLVVAAGGLAQGVYSVAAGRLLFDAGTTPAAILRAFAGRCPALLGTLLVSRVGMAIGAVVVIMLPVAAVRWMFIGEAVLLEGAGPFAALSRSRALGLRHGTRVLGLVSVQVLAAPLAALAADLAGNTLSATVLQSGQPLGELLRDGGSWWAVAGYLLALPWLASARFLSYVDLRTRKEGWDIQVRFLRIAARASRDTAEAA